MAHPEWAALEEAAGKLKMSLAQRMLSTDIRSPSYEREMIELSGNASGMDLLFSQIRQMVADVKKEENKEEGADE